MYHVKINHQLTIKELILLLLVVLILWFCLDVLFINRLDYFVLVAVVIFGILETVGNNYTYVSEILIGPVYMEIVYCNRNKIIDIVKIRRVDICSFDVFAQVTEEFGKIVQMDGNVSIKTNTEEEINFTMQTSYVDLKLSQIFNSTIQPLINLAKMQNKFKFKNFSYNIMGSEYTKLTMQHYIEHGKCSFLKELKITFNSSPLGAFKVIVFIITIGAVAITAIRLPLTIFIQNLRFNS